MPQIHFSSNVTGIVATGDTLVVGQATSTNDEVAYEVGVTDGEVAGYEAGAVTPEGDVVVTETTAEPTAETQI